MPRFRYPTQEPEPHRIRRLELMRRYPQLKELFGYSSLTAFVIHGIVISQLCLAWLVQSGADSGAWYGSLWFLIPVAWIAGGTFNHWAGMGIHEAAHNLVARKEVSNRWIAMIANIPIMFPSAMSFRRYHLKHHSHLGIFPEDNDLAMDFEIRWVGSSPWRKAVWLMFYIFFATLARGFLKKLSRWELVNIAFTIVADALIVHFIGWTGVGYLLLSTVFGYGLHPAAAHFIHEHYIWKEGQETYSYYGPLNWVTFNVGYHNEHHDLMWIPGWKLPIVRRTAPEFYDGQVSHRSWAWVLYHFIVNRKVGHDSRIVRAKETLRVRRMFSETPGLRRPRMTTEERQIEDGTAAAATPA